MYFMLYRQNWLNIVLTPHFCGQIQSKLVSNFCCVIKSQVDYFVHECALSFSSALDYPNFLGNLLKSFYAHRWQEINNSAYCCDNKHLRLLLYCTILRIFHYVRVK